MSSKNLVDIRDAIKDEMKKSSSAFSFRAFLDNFQLERTDGGKISIIVPNAFVAEKYEKDFRNDIEEIIYKTTNGEDRTFDVVCKASSAINEVNSEKSLGSENEEKKEKEKEKSHFGLNAKYKMDTFIVGDSNRFAHAVSMAVTASPGDTYNPLFLYGGVGLGKTHLMQAIGHKLLELGKLSNNYLAYETSETFCNEYIQALQSNNLDNFRRKYRKAEALLIDDVHFFGGKEKLQEEFFHTFNEIYQDGRQIVMTSDRPPIMLDNLQNRLVSRFKSGVVADIKRPDLETRLAILQKLSSNYGLEVSYECLELIAEKVTENIRELEGAFTKVVAMSSVMGFSVTSTMIEEVLADVSREKRSNSIDLQLIKRVVCEHYGIEIDEVIGKRRLRKLVIPRQVAMYLSHELTDETLQNIGSSFGGRDHTTVLHAFNKIEKEVKNASPIIDDIKVIRIRIKEEINS